MRASAGTLTQPPDHRAVLVPRDSAQERKLDRRSPSSNSLPAICHIGVQRRRRSIAERSAWHEGPPEQRSMAASLVRSPPQWQILAEWYRRWGRRGWPDWTDRFGADSADPLIDSAENRPLSRVRCRRTSRRGPCPRTCRFHSRPAQVHWTSSRSWRSANCRPSRRRIHLPAGYPRREVLL